MHNDAGAPHPRDLLFCPFHFSISVLIVRATALGEATMPLVAADSSTRHAP